MVGSDCSQISFENGRRSLSVNADHIFPVRESLITLLAHVTTRFEHVVSKFAKKDPQTLIIAITNVAVWSVEF